MVDISVLIPAYNASATLERALDSVIDQPVTEIIVVDDGSTDGTAEVAKKYGAAIRYFYQENAGIAASRNRGIKEAKSEWIAFLDADDEWLPHWVSTQEDLLKACPGISWLCCSHELVLNGIPVKIHSDEAASVFGVVRYFETRVRGVSMGTPGFLIHRSVFDEVGLFREEMRSGQDDDMWERIAMKHPDIGYNSSVCWRYWHDNPDSVTRTKRARDLHLKNICQNAVLAESLGRHVMEAFYPWGRKRAISYILRATAGRILVQREILDEARTIFPPTLSEYVLEVLLKVLPTAVAGKIAGRLID